MSARDKVRVTLRKSPIGGTERQRETVRGLGLRRIGQSRSLERSAAVLGMIRKVQHLIEVKD